MATVNTLKTRILNKYDLLANYSNFTPLKGEVCVAVIGEETTTNKGLNGDVTKKPIVGIKVVTAKLLLMTYLGFRLLLVTFLLSLRVLLMKLSSISLLML